MLTIPLYMDSILGSAYPIVTLTDVRSDTADLTTYTFSNCQINIPPGGTQPDELIADTIFGKSPNRGSVVVIVHGEDAATTFGVNSVSIGGVNGSERIDRGGGTSAINTAIYFWAASELHGITNTDIVVTWSEAVTSCAIGVLTVTNIGLSGQAVVTASAQGTGNINLSNSSSGTRPLFMAVSILGASCVTGGGTERPQFNIADQNYAFYPILLYEGNNAELGFAAAYAIHPPYVEANTYAFRVTWSGAGAGDAVMTTVC